MSEVLPLVYFTHAELREKENLLGELESVSVANGKVLSKYDTAKAKKRLRLSIRDDEMAYEAVEEDEQPFLVGVVDKSRGKLSVLNTAYFVMKPECYLSRRADEETQPEAGNQTYSEKLNSLTAAFGSSKKRKAMQTKLKNKIDTETLEAAVSLAVEESKKNPQRLENKEEENEENNNNGNNEEQFSVLPVPNKSANSPAEVYALNETLGVTQSEFDRFTLELSKKFAIVPIETVHKWKEIGAYSDFVCEHLAILISSKSNQQYKLKNCKLLAYLSFLITLYRLKSAQLRAKSPLTTLEVPESASNKLLALYTVSSSSNGAKNARSIPRRLKDKLTCHILILALHIDDFSTSLESFQKDLKMSMQRLSDFYQALGCFVKSEVTTVNKKKVISKTALLKLPLNEINKSEPKKRARKT